MEDQTRPTRVNFRLLVLISILLFACSKDFEDAILDNFDFSLSEEHADKGLIFEGTRTSFSLVPKREITTVDYFMKYSVASGKGYFLGIEGDTIRENDTLDIKGSNWAYNYMPLDTGLHKVKVLAWDSNDNQKELELLYHTDYASFSFLLNKGVNDFIINSKNPVNATLLRDKKTEGPDNKGEYELSYQIGNGTGKLYLGDRSFDAGKPIMLPKGVSELYYLPTTLGEHTIKVTAKAPDGATLSQDLVLNVLNLGFTFNATAASTQVELDTDLAINIDLSTRDDSSEVTYEISHSFSPQSTGGGTVRDQNGGVMEAGKFRALVPGSQNYTFTSTELGQRKIYFDVRDSNGQIKRDSVEIEVANIPFTFSGNSESNSVYRNERVQFNFNIRSNGNVSNIDYKLSYEILEGNGKLTGTNGNTMQNSTDYPVELGNFALYYFPESLGSHQISFSVTDNYGQVVGPVLIDLETKQNDFAVTFTPAKATEFANFPVNVIINIDEVPDGTNDGYLAFYSSGRNGSLRVNGTNYGPGEKFRLVPDLNNVVYTGTQPGVHDLVLSVESGSGVTHTANASIDYQQVDFLFTGGIQKSDISIGETTSLNFNLTESIGSSDYTMRYGSNGNALIKDSNGEQVGPGNIYDIPKGNFNWTLEGTDAGSLNMIFYVQNDTGLEKTVEIDMNVAPKDYNFTASATKSEAFTGKIVDVNFKIEELGIGGDSYTLYFSSGSSNGSFEYQGTVYAAGESFAVPVGPFQGKYMGISESRHNIQFTARSSSGVEKTANINIQYEKYEEYFDLTISQSSEDKYEGNPFDMTVVTNAVIGHDTDQTYSMTYSFVGASAGYIIYKGLIYREGETIPLDYGSTPFRFYPETDENFTINFRVENSTDISQTESESVVMFKRPMATAKGEKKNINCGGLNGCDYEVSIYTCFSTNCSEAYNGATIQQVEIRIYNRKDRRWDTKLYNYNDAQGAGVDRYFIMEEEGRESNLKYLDQNYEVRVRDSNDQWSDKVTGTIIRI